jgi:hypothetical protein
MNLTTLGAFIAKNVGALFIIVFDALIVAGAFLLIQAHAPVQDSPLVEAVTVLAYCFLVVGIAVRGWNSAKERASGGVAG